MMLIKKHKMFFYAILLSLMLHIISMSLVQKNSRVKYENVISFELLPVSQKMSKSNTENEDIDKKIEKPIENIKHTQTVAKNIKEPALEKALPVNKQQKSNKKDIKKKEEIGKENKQIDNNIKNNNAIESYAKAHLSNIQSQIVSKILYPQQAKKLGIEGSGYLIILIDSKGYIKSIKAKDFPHKLLENAALKAAKKVGQVAGHNLASIELKIPVNFYIR